MTSCFQIKIQTDKAEEELNNKTSSSKQQIKEELVNHETMVQNMMKVFIDNMAKTVNNVTDIDQKGREIMDNFVRQWVRYIFPYDQ